MPTTYAPATPEEVTTVMAAFYSKARIPTGFAVNLSWDPPVRRIVGGTPDPDELAAIKAARIVRGAELDAVRGRQRVLLYDDFGDYPNGSPSGAAVDVGGVTWGTTGAALPTVTDGKLSANGSGYLWATLPETPVIVEAEASFGGTADSDTTATIAIARTGGGTLIRDILHLTFGTKGAILTIEKDGTGTFAIISTPDWEVLPRDGTRHRVRLAVVGNRAIITGPRGETFTTRDPRIGDTLGTAYRTVFWQANTSTAAKAYLHTVAVYGESADGLTAANDTVSRGAANVVLGNPPRTVGAANLPQQVTIGSGNGGNSVNPTVAFGLTSNATQPDILRTTLVNAASAGATTILTTSPLYGFTSLTIGFGNEAETVAVSGTSGGTAPYTITVGALTKAHAAGAPVIATPVATRYKEIYLNMTNGNVYHPDGSVFSGTVYFGTGLDVALTRSAANTLATGSDDAFKVGRFATGSRPSAATVGQGAMIFDTTLNKPIWSDGAAWRDASGTVV